MRGVTVLFVLRSRASSIESGLQLSFPTIVYIKQTFALVDTNVWKLHTTSLIQLSLNLADDEWHILIFDAYFIKLVSMVAILKFIIVSEKTSQLEHLDTIYILLI